jgi:hypothetical protein
MSRPEARVVVLYEDKAHGSFLRRLVERLNLTPVRFQLCRDSTGVLRSLGQEVNALRSKNYQKNLGLVVVIDADEKGLRGRVDELLARIAAEASGGARGEAERIALVVPALEIENWYVHLCIPEARPIDEARDYKPSPEWARLEKDLGLAAKTAVAAWAPEAGRLDPQSLIAARDELGRVA